MSNKYLIAAVARRTGLSADTIRAWERRHGLIHPLRDDSGVRLYSEPDVARLELARAAVLLGHPIRQVAPMTDADLRTLLEGSSHKALPASDETRAAQETVGALVSAVRDYDLERAESRLNAAALLLEPIDLIVEIVAPFMREIGALWSAKALSIAQEHFASTLVRSLLGSLLHLRPPSGDEKMLFLTPPGESHELGLLCAACIAASHGIRAIVLGTNIPANDAVRAARSVGPNRVIVGLVWKSDRAARSRYLANLRRRIPARIPISIGGEGAHDIPPALIPQGVDVILDLKQFGQSKRARL